MDEEGVTHFSERNVADRKSEEISEKISKEGNFIEFGEFEELGDTELPKLVEDRKEEKITVKIHIELIGYGMSKERLNLIGNQIRGMYTFYVESLGWDPVAPWPVKIKIFGDHHSFERYQAETSGSLPYYRSHYSHRNREVLMHGTEFAEATMGVLFHEASHAIMAMRKYNVSPWISEGIAEVFESSTYTRGKMVFRKNDEWTRKIQHKLREGSLEPAQNYFNYRDKWSGEGRRAERRRYMIAWSLMRFLLSTPERINALKGGLSGDFASHYPGGIKALDKDWRQWIRQL
ncbi:MAG: DUF1570 domain-containing protein [Porticoccaceae bacterium]|nr:DUF1570 domain-containing protein [Porticoccaceae bacterium]